MLDNNLNDVEILADYAHSTWSKWMNYMISKSIMNTDSSMTVPKELLERWSRQMNTEYKDLSEEEKISDRKEAEKILSILKKN